MIPLKGTLKKMAAGEGQTLGFVRPVKLFEKTPFPCVVPWTTVQMFEQTDNVQQCVKARVKKS